MSAKTPRPSAPLFEDWGTVLFMFWPILLLLFLLIFIGIPFILLYLTMGEDDNDTTENTTNN